ncbi:hypothetical protein THARTR1_01335 [Trichoderma harzianum]|uniref:Putative gamma-glutamylcyclotransferase n=1 Tax=Trichoderma harzianum TaxID=5544 RepID=A0A2K0UMS3_TRIHA|nr:hypothetical protein THARTR1_01335 [Trichoderma harzianum]
MDFLAACEDLAANVAAFDFVDGPSDVSESDRSMWQALFDFSSDEAVEAIRNWRADFARPTLSQAAWLIVKEAKTAEGFNKESYEYSIFKEHEARKKSRESSSGIVAANGGAQYLLKLEVEAADTEILCRLPKKPNILTGLDGDGNTTRFCLLSGIEKSELLKDLPKTRQPTFIRVSIAQKALSSTSLCPTLGFDTTMPQFRPANSPLPPPLARPGQDEYPVWYFFYGTLADADILSRIIGLGKKGGETQVEYKRARIRRGKLSTWGGKYLALVDADEDSTVDGCAYQVKDQNQEDSLRVYETGKYEAVRCTMELLDGDGRFLQGLTFRLA